MARSAVTDDVFTAIAEPRRREILHLLSDGREWAVNDVVLRLRLAQPAVSKHLGVLRRVGVVRAAKRGQQRMYTLEARELKRVYDWAQTFERYWNNRVERIKQRAEEKAMQQIEKENTKRK